MDVLVEQHRAITRMLGALRRESYHRDRLFARLRSELSLHLTVEVHVLYPAVARTIPKGGAGLKVLRLANETLASVASPNRRSPDEVMRVCSQVDVLFSVHAAVQEQELFPACKAQLDAERLEEIRSDIESFYWGLRARSLGRPGAELHPPG